MIFPFERCLCLPPPVSSSLTLVSLVLSLRDTTSSHHTNSILLIPAKTEQEGATALRPASPQKRDLDFTPLFPALPPRVAAFALRPRACRGLNYLLGLIVTLGLRTSWPTLLLTSISLLDILFNFTTLPRHTPGRLSANTKTSHSSPRTAFTWNALLGLGDRFQLSGSLHSTRFPTLSTLSSTYRLRSAAATKRTEERTED